MARFAGKREQIPTKFYLVSGIGRVIEIVDDVLPGEADPRAGNFRIWIQLQEYPLQDVQKSSPEKLGDDVIVIGSRRHGWLAEKVAGSSLATCCSDKNSSNIN